MSKAKRLAIWIALACIAAGVAVAFAAWGASGFDLSRMETMKWERKSYEVDQPFAHIQIEGMSNTVRLVPAQDGKCRVVCSESEKISHTVSVEQGTLTIVSHDRRRWYEHIGVFWGVQSELSTTVYLPQREYEDLSIQCASGDVSVPADFTFTMVQIKTASGEIEYAAPAKGDVTLHAVSGDIDAAGLTARALELHTTSGDVDLSQSQADSLSVQSTSGTVKLRSVRAAGAADVTTVSGEIELEYLQAQDITLRSTSGDVELEDVTASAGLDIKTVSGEIGLARSDAQTLRLKSTSGDVSGTLRSGKLFQTHTTSGDIRVPNSSPDAGLCEITTTSGDIHLRLSE